MVMKLEKLKISWDDKMGRINDHKLNRAYRLCLLDYFKYLVQEDFKPETTHIDFYAFQRKLEDKYYMETQKEFEKDFGAMSPLPRLLHSCLEKDLIKLFQELDKIVVY